MKMAVATVLIFAPGIRLGKLECAAQAENHGIGIEGKTDVAQQMNGTGAVPTIGKINGATTSRVASLDGYVDRGRVIGHAVSRGSEVFDIIGLVRKGRGWEIGRGEGVISGVN
jgi:hypothetical protein